MKTSRIARETARISQHSEIITTRRTTRSFAKSIHGFAAEDAGVELNQEISRDDDASSLSSVNSKVILDIEESITPKSTPRKRKRGFESPITAATALPAVTTRTSPLKEKSASQNGQQLRPRIKKGRRQPAKQVVTDDGEVEIHPPANWAEIYSAVQEMRKRVLAPVDTMGCERIAEDKRTPRVC